MAPCQYDWSANTVPKLPTTLAIPKMRDPEDLKVKNEPLELVPDGPARMQLLC